MNRKERRANESVKKKLEKKVSDEQIVMEFGSPPEVLQAVGPIIVTELGITPQHARMLKDAGEAVPPPVRCRFLIDSGASNCLVKHEIAERAGLKLISASAPVHGVGVDTTGKTYFGRIFFGAKSRISPDVQHNMVVDAVISSGDLKNAPLFEGLIGRDVLRHFEMRYHGGTGKFSLRWLRPTKGMPIAEI